MSRRQAVRVVTWAVVLLVVIVGVANGIASLRERARIARGMLETPDAAPPRDEEAGVGGAGVLDTLLPVPDSLRGRSGALRFRTLTRAGAVAVPGLIERHGEGAIRRPAIYRVPIDAGRDTFAYVVTRAFGEKRGAYLNGYRLGAWPAERWMMAANYRNPDGFIEVTPADVDLRLSPHFTLGAFVTHDRQQRWPKYVVLQESLIDKLELVLADLAARGVAADRVRVLSGFRAPYYNDALANEGSARASRHQYGDAADIVVDADGDGRMDDLNRDGRVDLRDTDVILRAVERVERAHAALVGGLGLYHAMGPSGPFAHVDVRGTSARWLR
jgi:hypothetical protein